MDALTEVLECVDLCYGSVASNMPTGCHIHVLASVLAPLEHDHIMLRGVRVVPAPCYYAMAREHGMSVVRRARTNHAMFKLVPRVR